MRSSTSSSSGVGTRSIVSAPFLFRAFVFSWLFPRPPGKSLELQGLSIRLHLHRPVPIGPEDLRTHRAVSRQDLRNRMPEVIAPPRADDGNGGVDRVQELCGAGRQAPAMRNLDDADR